MMVIVRVIDLVVLFLQILVGRAVVPAPVRALAWIAAASLVVAAIGLTAYVISLLPELVGSVAGIDV